jgi:hypothetical protein
MEMASGEAYGIASSHDITGLLGTTLSSTRPGGILTERRYSSTKMGASWMNEGSSDRQKSSGRNTMGVTVRAMPLTGCQAVEIRRRLQGYAKAAKPTASQATH